jgi:hypothetical protein
MNLFLSGAIFISATISFLFFLRFWKDSKDRFFLLFSISFALLSLERLALVYLVDQKEFHWLAYSIRLMAYLVILAAIVSKNQPYSDKS